MYWERSNFLLATSLLLAVTFSPQSIPAQCDGIDNLFWDVSIHVTFGSIAISSYCVGGLFVPVINAFSCFVIHWLKGVLPTSYSDYILLASYGCTYKKLLGAVLFATLLLSKDARGFLYYASYHLFPFLKWVLLTAPSRNPPPPETMLNPHPHCTESPLPLPTFLETLIHHC